VVNAQPLLAYGGAPLSGYTWTLAPGSTFPPGTTVVPLTGVFKGSGGTVVPGTYFFDMVVSDGSRTATRTFQFNVETASGGSLCGKALFQQSVLSSINLPHAKAGRPYGCSLMVWGGTPPYTWSLGPGESLPGGLVVVGAGRVVAGRTGGRFESWRGAGDALLHRGGEHL
jgi:hypothetical protein